jgi:hypothetical protein
MSVPSLDGQWGFGCQTAKGSAATTFRRYRALRVGGGPVTITEPMPPEVGGIPITDGAHKLGAYHAGVVDMVPRLEDDIGYLLYALCGNVSEVSDSPESGLTTHYFRMDPSAYLALKWITMRRVFPAPEGGTASGVQALDTRIAGLVLNFAAAARMTGRVSTYGRIPSLATDISGWSWDAQPEDDTSVAISANTGAYFKLPQFQAGNLPTQMVRVTFGNQVSQPNQEFVIGSPYPDDIVSLYRNVAVEVAYKWEDEDLYNQLCFNAGSGASVAWSPVVYQSDFRIKEVSDANISGYTSPYSIEIYCPRVIWFPTAPPEIAGLNLLQLPVAGVVARPTSGDPFQIILVNETASYIWS